MAEEKEIAFDKREVINPTSNNVLFNPVMFQRMFLEEKKSAFNLSDDDFDDEKVKERDKIGALESELLLQAMSGKQVSPEEFEDLKEKLNAFTDADVYRYSLNKLNKWDDLFNCGIERTELLFFLPPSPQSFNDYKKEKKESREDEKELKVKYIQDVLFTNFYKYISQKYRWDEESIYRLFIRLLSLCDGFSVISNILIISFGSVIRLTSPTSSQQSSPEEPQVLDQTTRFRNKNIIQVSNSQPIISLTNVLFFRLVDPTYVLNDSNPFKILVKYDLLEMSNHPFSMILSTLFEMNSFFKSGETKMSDIELSRQICSEVAEFISSLNLKINSNSDSDTVLDSLQKICIILQTIDFDVECGPMSLDIKNETFYWFEILLKKNKESKDIETPQSKKLARSLNKILEPLWIYDLLRENKGLSQEDVKIEFFKRNGGKTTANKNIYDLIMYIKKQNSEAVSQVAAEEYQEKISNLFENFGGRKSNKRSSKKRISKKCSSEKRISKKCSSKKRSSKKRISKKRGYKKRSCKK